MIHETMQKTVWVINVPAAAVNANPFTTASIDTRGWGHCSIYFRLGAIGAAAMTVLKIQESNDDGAVDTYADVPGLVCTGASGQGRLPQATDDDKLFAFHIDLKGRERYLDLVATAGAADTWAVAYAVLSRGKEAANSNTERGIESELRLPT